MRLLFFTLIHEMAHAVGHRLNFNQKFMKENNIDECAKEEIRTELSTLFLHADMGLQMNDQYFQEKSNYILGWLFKCNNNYDELFRASADAEIISQRLENNYEQYMAREIKPQYIQQNTLSKTKAQSKTNLVPFIGLAKEHEIEDGYEL